MKLDKQISELLYDHECVIVPELGGFLSSYSNSRIHPTQHTVTPPSKKIAFNVFLRHNDGLLANYIVQTHSVTYPEALREIENYVELCNHALRSGKKFVIEQVGILTRDSESNLQFEPFKNVNYLKDSFGLSPLQLIPVLHSDFENEVEKQLRDFISIRPSQAQPRKPMVRRRVRLNSLNTTLLTGSILWFCLNLYIVSPEEINFASLNPFTIDTPATKSPASGESEIYTQPAFSNGETAAVSGTAPENTAGKFQTPAPLTPDQNLSSKQTTQNFFIVAGAYHSLMNASRKVSELKAQGFANARTVDSPNGLKLVCYEGFGTREEAFTALNRLKSDHQDAWIFSR